MSGQVATVEADREVAGVGPEVTGEPVAEPDTEVVAADLLVEEVSIDGMCGVY